MYLRNNISLFGVVIYQLVPETVCGPVAQAQPACLTLVCVSRYCMSRPINRFPIMVWCICCAAETYIYIIIWLIKYRAVSFRAGMVERFLP